MSDTVIKLQGIGKKYRIRHQRQLHNVTLRDAIAEKFSSVFRLDRPKAEATNSVEDFWALKDVSFEIKRGEVVGIIGRNGAGKSTLLKIMSRITEPTTGRMEIDGRVASLLEVGTGFHPELSGRENIYLNGAVMGMTRTEITRKFDEIVAFAEVDKFLDTPVKRYSSGMYVRLAFAVAAHLEPEILIVDEVLAVGDAEFQKRCFGKLHDISSHEGRTVLLVSHNMAAISEMAPRALLIESGRIAVDDVASVAVSEYLGKTQNDAIYVSRADRPTRSPHVSRIEVFTSEPKGIQRFEEPLEIKFWIRHDEPLSRGCFSFQIVNQYQQPVIHAFIYYPDIRFGGSRGESILACRFPMLRLNVGRFQLRTILSEPPGGDVYETLEGICPFEVVRTDKTVLWGWQPKSCAYHEQWNWTAMDVGKAAAE